jgi:hypothetical protein
LIGSPVSSCAFSVSSAFDSAGAAACVSAFVSAAVVAAGAAVVADADEPDEHPVNAESVRAAAHNTEAIFLSFIMFLLLITGLPVVFVLFHTAMLRYKNDLRKRC